MAAFETFQKLQFDTGVVGKLFRSKEKIDMNPFGYKRLGFKMPMNAYALLTAVREPEDDTAAGWPHSFIVDLIVNEKVCTVFFSRPEKFWLLFEEDNCG